MLEKPYEPAPVEPTPGTMTTEQAVRAVRGRQFGLEHFEPDQRLKMAQHDGEKTFLSKSGFVGATWN